MIVEADFQGYLKSVYAPEEVKEIHRAPSRREHALEAYLDSVAIAAKARREGIDQEPRFKKAQELMEVKLLSYLVAERHRAHLLQSARVAPEEVKAYYEHHKNELTVEPRFTAHHLLVYVKGNAAFPEKGLGDAEARARAEEALTQLRQGASWDTVAKRYSDEVAASQHGGLIRDGQFGYFPAEVEQAMRTQPLGKPGELVKSAFGYHVLQVEDRVTQRRPQPFEKVKKLLSDRLSEQRSAEARKAFMTPLREEVGFKVSEAGERDGLLVDETAVAPGEVLAEVGGRHVLEADFRWFLRDALTPAQRMSASSRPGARRSMVSSFLDMLVLEAKARKEGLDKSPDFIRSRVVMEEKLLSELVQERDRAGLSRQCGKTDEERRLAQRTYLEHVRAEVGLSRASGRSSAAGAR